MFVVALLWGCFKRRGAKTLRFTEERNLRTRKIALFFGACTKTTRRKKPLKKKGNYKTITMDHLFFFNGFFLLVV
jgi:hypothetical protein